jgi:hypothetical protein
MLVSVQLIIIFFIAFWLFNRPSASFSMWVENVTDCLIVFKISLLHKNDYDDDVK